MNKTYVPLGGFCRRLFVHHSRRSESSSALQHFSSGDVNLLAGFIGPGIIIATIVVMLVTLYRIINTSIFPKRAISP